MQRHNSKNNNNIPSEISKKNRQDNLMLLVIDFSLNKKNELCIYEGQHFHGSYDFLEPLSDSRLTSETIKGDLKSLLDPVFQRKNYYFYSARCGVHVQSTTKALNEPVPTFHINYEMKSYTSKKKSSYKYINHRESSVFIRDKVIQRVFLYLNDSTFLPKFKVYRKTSGAEKIAESIMKDFKGKNIDKIVIKRGDEAQGRGNIFLDIKGMEKKHLIDEVNSFLESMGSSEQYFLIEEQRHLGKNSKNNTYSTYRAVSAFGYHASEVFYNSYIQTEYVSSGVDSHQVINRYYFNTKPEKRNQIYDTEHPAIWVKDNKEKIELQGNAPTLYNQLRQFMKTLYEFDIKKFVIDLHSIKKKKANEIFDTPDDRQKFTHDVINLFKQHPEFFQCYQQNSMVYHDYDNLENFGFTKFYICLYEMLYKKPLLDNHNIDETSHKRKMALFIKTTPPEKIIEDIKKIIEEYKIPELVNETSFETIYFLISETVKNKLETVVDYLMEHITTNPKKILDFLEKSIEENNNALTNILLGEFLKTVFPKNNHEEQLKKLVQKVVRDKEKYYWGVSGFLKILLKESIPLTNKKLPTIAFNYDERSLFITILTSKYLVSTRYSNELLETAISSVNTINVKDIEQFLKKSQHSLQGQGKKPYGTKEVLSAALNRQDVNIIRLLFQYQSFHFETLAKLWDRVQGDQTVENLFEEALISEAIRYSIDMTAGNRHVFSFLICKAINDTDENLLYNLIKWNHDSDELGKALMLAFEEMEYGKDSNRASNFQKFSTSILRILEKKFSTEESSPYLFKRKINDLLRKYDPRCNTLRLSDYISQELTLWRTPIQGPEEQNNKDKLWRYNTSN